MIQFLYPEFYFSHIHDLLTALLLSHSIRVLLCWLQFILVIFPHQEPSQLSNGFAINFHGLYATSLTSSPLLLTSCFLQSWERDTRCFICAWFSWRSLLPFISHLPEWQKAQRFCKTQYQSLNYKYSFKSPQNCFESLVHIVNMKMLIRRNKK